MRLFQTLKISVSVLFCVLFVLGTAILVYPFLQRAFEVEETDRNAEVPRLPKEAKEPEKVRVQLLCALNEERTEFTGFYLEILNNYAETVFYFEIPAYTKVTISQGLYRKLQAYSPGLPQYLKLSRLAGSFSEDYRMQGTSQVLEELLGISIAHWCSMEEAALKEWMEAVLDEKKNPSEFFRQYQHFAQKAASDQTALELWMYYDAYRSFPAAWEGTIPGTEGIGEFEVNGWLAKDKLESCIRRTGN